MKNLNFYIILACLIIHRFCNCYYEIGIWSDWNMFCGIAQHSEHLYKAFERANITAVKYSHHVDYANILKQIEQDKIKILNVQFDYYLIKDELSFINLLHAIKSKNIKIVITVHQEEIYNYKILQCADCIVYHKPPTIFKRFPFIIIQLPIPVFNPPTDNKFKLRKKYGFTFDQKIITTTGFIFPQKALPEILTSLEPYIKRDEKIVIQFLNAISNRAIHVCEPEGLRLKTTIKNLSLENQVIFIDTFLPQNELSERLWISDVGFTWFNQPLASVSATEREFIASRLPFVANHNEHFNISGGVLKTASDISAFTNSIITLLNNHNHLKKLRLEAQKIYSRYNYDSAIKHYLNVFEKVLQ